MVAGLTSGRSIPNVCQEGEKKRPLEAADAYITDCFTAMIERTITYLRTRSNSLAKAWKQRDVRRARKAMRLAHVGQASSGASRKGAGRNLLMCLAPGAGIEPARRFRVTQIY